LNQSVARNANHATEIAITHKATVDIIRHLAGAAVSLLSPVELPFLPARITMAFEVSYPCPYVVIYNAVVHQHRLPQFLPEP